VESVQAEGQSPAYQLLHVVQQAVLQPYGFEGQEVHLLPLVPDIITAVHLQQRLLLADPPEGECCRSAQMKTRSPLTAPYSSDIQPVHRMQPVCQNAPWVWKCLWLPLLKATLHSTSTHSAGLLLQLEQLCRCCCCCCCCCWHVCRLA
jgi:hypothetical protein